MLAELDGAVCLGRDRAHGRADLGCSRDLARREAQVPGPAGDLGRLASVDVRRGVPARKRASTSPCRRRAKRPSRRSCARLAAGRVARGLRRLHVPPSPTAAMSRESAARAAAAGRVPAARLRADSGRALLRAQGQAAARLHLVAGLQFPLRVLLGSRSSTAASGSGLDPTRRWRCEVDASSGTGTASTTSTSRTRPSSPSASACARSRSRSSSPE